MPDEKEVEKNLGIIEGAVDKEVIDKEVAQVEDKKEEIKEKRIPSFFIKKDQKVRIDVDVLFKKDTGDIVSVTSADPGFDLSMLENIFDKYRIWVEFSMPDYNRMSTYRRQASRVHDNTLIVETNALRQFYLAFHLKDWNVTDDEGKKIELKHDPDGSLKSESIEKVGNISPVIMDVILTCFERKMLLN